MKAVCMGQQALLLPCLGNSETGKDRSEEGGQIHSEPQLLHWGRSRMSSEWEKPADSCSGGTSCRPQGTWACREGASDELGLLWTECLLSLSTWTP